MCSDRVVTVQCHDILCTPYDNGIYRKYFWRKGANKIALFDLL